MVDRLFELVVAGSKSLMTFGVCGICVFWLNATVRAATPQALWVFPGSSFANPITDPAARQTLVTNSTASGVSRLYVSVYSSTPNSAGRYMYDDAVMADLISKAHGAGIGIDAAYGAPDWPSFGCDPNGFPLQRIAEVIAYNSDHPSTKFDGVILDVEPPEPQSTTAYQALLAQYRCMRDALPSGVDLSVAIRFFWNDSVQFPANTGAIKPVYAHVIDMNLRNVVVMGYRDFAGPSDCSNDGIVCLDQDEISYARSIGKFDIILAGLETSDPGTTGISNKETFFEEGQGQLNLQAQTVLDHFGILSGLGGFAIHNYQNTYLSGGSVSWPQTNSSFPTVAHELSVTAFTRMNGQIQLQGTGVANRVYKVEMSPDLATGSFAPIDSVMAGGNGVLDYSRAAGSGKAFYRFSYP